MHVERRQHDVAGFDDAIDVNQRYDKATIAASSIPAETGWDGVWCGGVDKRKEKSMG